MLLMTVVALAGCGKVNPSGESATAPGALELVLEYTIGDGDDPDARLRGEVKSLVVDSSDNAYVLTDHNGASVLACYDANGSLVWDVRRSGNGPGDLRYAMGLAFNGDSTLFVANQVATRIDRFSVDGRFVGSTPVRDIGLSRFIIAGYVQPSYLIGWETLAGEYGAKVSAIDVSGDWGVANTFNIIQTGGREINDQIAFPPEISVVRSRIVASHIDEYAYDWYSTSGERVREIVRDDVTIEPPAVWGSELGVSFTKPSRMYSMFVIGSRFVAAGGSWPAKPVSQDRRIEAAFGRGPRVARVSNLDLFDRETGALVRSLAAESYGIKRLVGSDARGRIYAVLIGDDLAIGRFRIDGWGQVLNRASPQ